MIEKLTKQQEDKIGEYYKEWLSIGVSCEPADRVRAEMAICGLYKIEGYKTPEFLWCRSPLEARQKYQCKTVYFLGQMDAYWICFYLYCRDVLGIKYDDKYSRILDLYAEIAKSCGWWYPYECAVVICEKPIECHMKSGLLHNDNGMAIRYNDGFGSWNLNGVMVSRELVESKAEDLDPKILFKEKNAEVRREIVRKIGIDRIVYKLGAISLDKDGDYELLNINIGDSRKRPYLKMKNPSIHTWHLEGVPPRIVTVKAALDWRNGTEMRPDILT